MPKKYKQNKKQNKKNSKYSGNWKNKEIGVKIQNQSQEKRGM